MGLVVLVTVLFAACSGGSDDSEMQMTDAEGKPMSGAGTETKNGASEDTAPDFELVLFETENHAAGEVLRLSDLRGRPVVLNFWFPSCPPCRAEMPDLERTFQNHKADGVEFVGPQLLGLDSAQDGQDFVDEIGVTYALGADETGDILKDYKITGFPTTVFIDADQRIVRKWTGVLNEEKLEELIEKLLE